MLTHSSKPYCAKNFVGEMPLSEVAGAIRGVREQLREAGRGFLEGDVIGDAAVGVGPLAGHRRRPRRRADRLRVVTAVKHNALGGETVQNGHAVPWIAIDGERVGALFLSPEKKEIGLVGRWPAGAAKDRRRSETGAGKTLQRCSP